VCVCVCVCVYVRPHACKQAYFSASLFFPTLVLPPRIFAYFGRLPKLVIHTINEARQQLERFLPLRQAVRTRKPKLRGVQRIDLPTLGQLLKFALRLGGGGGFDQDCSAVNTEYMHIKMLGGGGR
jgi:hypothetical protein